MSSLDTRCPITHTRITELADPVLAADGVIYEREDLLKWVRMKGTSPTNPQMILSSSAIERAPTVYGILSTSAPPRPPGQENKLVSRLLLSLDVSGSMGAAVSGFDEKGKREDHGLTALDVAKHAVLTLGHCMRSDAHGECGEIEVHTFSNSAKKILPMCRMDPAGIKRLEEALKHVHTEGATNLWAAIHKGIGNAIDYSGCPVIILTDGVATAVPPRGHEYMMDKLIKKCRAEGKAIPKLRCMGFGPDIDSLTLRTLSTRADGTFIYVPDVGFVGTASQHLLANTLVPEPPVETQDARLLRGHVVEVLEKMLKVAFPESPSRGYRRAQSTESLSQEGLSEAATIWSSFKAGRDVPDILKEPQVDLAIKPMYADKWGKHYIRSLADAFKHRECVNFKDASLQAFGTLRAPVWRRVLDHADEIYCELPPPKPSRGFTSIRARFGGGSSQGGDVVYRSLSPGPGPAVTMRSYSQPTGPCFHEETLLTTSRGMIPCKLALVGDMVWTGEDWDQVQYILETSVPSGHQEFIRVGELLVTAWHPVLQDGKWVHPWSLGQPETCTCSYVYSFVLKGRSAAIQVGDQVAITLAHGLDGSVAKHAFWGTEAVVKALDIADLVGWKGPRKVTIVPTQVVRVDGVATSFTMPARTHVDREWIQLAE